MPRLLEELGGRVSQRKSGREWIPEGPAPASAADPIAVLGRLSTDSLIPQGGAGPVAGPVERRQASEAMRAAWRREALPDLPAIAAPVPPRMTEEELVDAYRSSAPAGGPAPEKEEPAMAADSLDPYAELAEAASEASEAHQGLLTAQERWTAAERRLQEIWASAHPPVEAAPPPNIPRTIPVAVQAREPRRRRPGGDQERQESVEARGQRVLEVLARHNGNTKAAGVELGMRGNIVARIAKAARDRQAKAS